MIPSPPLTLNFSLVCAPSPSCTLSNPCTLLPLNAHTPSLQEHLSLTSHFPLSCALPLLHVLPHQQPPHWPSGSGVRLDSRPRVQILLALGFFGGSSHNSDLKIGTPVATLPGIWCYRVSTGNGQPSVCILWLGEMESLVCNFHLSVAACTTVWADPSLRYTYMLLGR